MALIKCRKCKKEISSQARKCPYCKNDVMFDIVGIFSFIIGIICLISMVLKCLIDYFKI